MPRFLTVVESAALLAVLCFPAFASTATPFSHVVVIVQENRTPDNLFNGLQNYLPEADIATSGLDSKGQTIALTAEPLATSYDLSHSHPSFLKMYDGGKMDGANLIPCSPKKYCQKFPQYRYVQNSDVVPYFEIAENYGFANRMFSTQQGPSFPGHQFILSGTSAPSATSPDFASENPEYGVSDYGNGCIADAQQRVEVIDPSGSESGSIYPCFEHETLTDVLDAAAVSWRYYTPPPKYGSGWLWDAPLAIAHMCVSSGYGGTCTGSDFTKKEVYFGPAQILTDIQDGQLRAVSWVIPNSKESDHPQTNDGSGPSWVASVVDAIGESSYWDSTAIFITWDDWGGWYDHVAPPIDSTYGYYEYGFRVPLLVVSPYTPKGYVSNTTLDFGSILKFAETVFGLGTIPPGTFADARANLPSDFFDFSQSPRPFVAISAP